MGKFIYLKSNTIYTRTCRSPPWSGSIPPMGAAEAQPANWPGINDREVNGLSGRAELLLIKGAPSESRFMARQDRSRPRYLLEL